MPCCGKGKRNPARPNGKVCPKCGWAMHRVHKYDTQTKQVVKYWNCSNKTAFRSNACNFKEKIV